MKAIHNPPLRACPFCNNPVLRLRGYNGLNFFKCTNKIVCGAVMSFDNDYYNAQPEEAYRQFNRRADDEKGGEQG